MHLALVSPKQPGHSLDLRFSEKFVVFDNCDHGYCTGPLTGWKIEGNRLKLGDHQDEGDALIGVSDTILVLHDKEGKVYTYAIARP